ncbi:alpha/beta hydrolase [Micromonospora eburnea]|uniref:Alpha/beta hydrolase family protein n=1 Tax=Micromonospora eburnea TaxID=227316 RepID=A0A1C6V0R1_9ACTN|nr:alpha/beta hydrolase [Micromonospora eburnea]SCL59888.1 Alpha/beta hydrolase family protein [Micromonospora eburnea]
MHDVAELKQFVVVHARGQKIANHRGILDRISGDHASGAGSWVAEWTAVAERLEERGRLLEASRHYAMARFPFADGPARREAQDRCVHAFDRWRASQNGIERLDVDLPDGRVRCWSAGLDQANPRPLLLVMGGIVTVKEQWGPMLGQIAAMGMAGIVTEMPNVGENTLRYGPESWRMLSGVLDAVSDRADVAHTYAMTLSFSGHLALRCAVDDSRIRAVITTGAPVSDFFTDTTWQRRVPLVTTRTVAHLMGVGATRVFENLPDFALAAAQLRAPAIPVRYVASRRDEIIPATDWHQLRQHVPDCEVLEIDDVHGAPGHVLESRLWCLRALLRIRDVHGPMKGGVDLLCRLLQARRRLAAPRGEPAVDSPSQMRAT